MSNPIYRVGQIRHQRMLELMKVHADAVNPSEEKEISLLLDTLCARQGHRFEQELFDCPCHAIKLVTREV